MISSECWFDDHSAGCEMMGAAAARGFSIPDWSVFLRCGSRMIRRLRRDGIMELAVVFLANDECMIFCQVKCEAVAVAHDLFDCCSYLVLFFCHNTC